MPNEESFLVIRKLSNPEAEGMIDLITRMVASLKLHEHSEIQPRMIAVIRQMLILEACSPSCMDDAKKNVSGNPTTYCFPS